MLSRSPLRPVALRRFLLRLSLLLFGAPAALWAQGPTTVVTPVAGTYDSPNLMGASFKVEWKGTRALDAGTRWIKLNGELIHANFSYDTPDSVTATSRAWVRYYLKDGTNTIETRICDTAGQCHQFPGTYTFNREPAGSGSAPVVSISPKNTTVSTASQQVRVLWQDDSAFDGGTRSIKLNGTAVTGSFSYYERTAADEEQQESVGTLTLAPGQNVIEARICDYSGKCSKPDTSLITFQDPSAPRVGVSPADTTTNVPEVQLKVQWRDDKVLDSSTRWVTLRGSYIHASLTYTSPEGGLPHDTAATSAGKITLVSGANEVQARICDTEGRCTTTKRTYTYVPKTDATAPTVRITPGTSSHTSATLQVRIDYADDVWLDNGTRVVTFNGQNLNATIGYTEPRPDSAYSVFNVTLLEDTTNTLSARICDKSGKCSETVSASYAYGTGAPAIALTPSGGTYTSPSLPLTIDLSDAEGIRQDSLKVWLNGTLVSGLSYTSTATTAQAKGTLTLKKGSNTLDVRACDLTNACRTKGTTYLWDSEAPVLQVPADALLSAPTYSLQVVATDDARHPLPGARAQRLHAQA